MAFILSHKLRITPVFRDLLPWIIGVCPVLVFHLTHWLSAQAGYVPWCIPYWESCTSISATGRNGIAFYVFKLAMLPAAVILVFYWETTWERLHATGYANELPRTIPRLGCVAASFLTLYTVALGIEGDLFQLQRRIGITVFFILTYLTQFLYTLKVTRLDLPDPTRKFQWHLSRVILATGLLTLILDAVDPDYDDYEDAFEWVIVLLLQCFFVLSFWSWRALDQLSAQGQHPPANDSGPH